MEKYFWVVLIISAIGVTFVYMFLYKFSLWLIGVIKPVSSGQRHTIAAYVLATVLFGALTGFTFLRAILGVLS
jgi:hypothetical protein